MALPPDDMPSLNSGAPSSIALVPSYVKLCLLTSTISAFIISCIASSDNASFYSQCVKGVSDFFDLFNIELRKVMFFNFIFYITRYSLSFI